MPLKKSSLSVSTNLMYYGGRESGQPPKLCSLILLRFFPSDLPIVLMILKEKKSHKVSQKGPEMKVNKCDKLGLTAWGDFKEIFCDIQLELPLFNTTKLCER